MNNTRDQILAAIAEVKKDLNSVIVQVRAALQKARVADGKQNPGQKHQQELSDCHKELARQFGKLSALATRKGDNISADLYGDVGETCARLSAAHAAAANLLYPATVDTYDNGVERQVKGFFDGFYAGNWNPQIESRVRALDIPPSLEKSASGADGGIFG